MKFGIQGGMLSAGLATVLLFLPASAQQQEQRVVTLEEAVQLALRASPVIVQREGAIATAESAERTSLGAFLPTLSMSSGASRSSSTRFDPNNNITVTGSSSSYNAGLNTGLELFDAGRRFAARSQAKAQTKSAEAQMVEQRFQVTLQVKQTYFNVIRADETIRSSEAAVQRAEQGLRASIQRKQVGSATISDSLRSQLELIQAQQTLLQAQNARRDAGYRLGALMGYDGPVAADPNTPTAPRPLALTDDELLQLAIEQSPSVRSAAASVEQQNAGVRVARAQYFPTLRASGGFSWSNDQAQLDGGRRSWSTGLSLSYNLFNGFSREDANERARVNARNAQATFDDARRQARANVRSAIDAVRLAEQQIAIAQEGLRVAEEDLRVQQTRYELSASTILDRITSQEAVVRAELTLIGARYDYLVARAELEALVGREL
jgi:outer membrane protein TolC